MMFWKDGDRFFIVLSPALNSGKSEPREETSLMSCFLTDGDTLFFSSFHCLKVPRQLERRPAPRKGRVSGPEFKTEPKKLFPLESLQSRSLCPPRSGQMETSLWASSKPVFPVERAFMRHNPETSLSEGWKGFKINFKF